MGFHAWLVVRANEGNNLTWPALAQRQLPVHTDDAELPEDDRAVRALGRLLAEFFEYRRANGMAKIFHDYARWLLRRSWYIGPLRRSRHNNA